MKKKTFNIAALPIAQQETDNNYFSNFPFNSLEDLLVIILRTIWSFDLWSALFSFASLMIYSEKNQNNISATFW